MAKPQSAQWRAQGIQMLIRSKEMTHIPLPSPQSRPTRGQPPRLLIAFFFALPALIFPWYAQAGTTQRNNTPTQSATQQSESVTSRRSTPQVHHSHGDASRADSSALKAGAGSSTETAANDNNNGSGNSGNEGSGGNSGQNGGGTNNNGGTNSGGSSGGTQRGGITNEFNEVAKQEDDASERSTDGLSDTFNRHANPSEDDDDGPTNEYTPPWSGPSR
jgi:hypothetical protein